MEETLWVRTTQTRDGTGGPSVRFPGPETEGRGVGWPLVLNVLGGRCVLVWGASRGLDDAGKKDSTTHMASKDRYHGRLSAWSYNPSSAVRLGPRFPYTAYARRWLREYRTFSHPPGRQWSTLVVGS